MGGGDRGDGAITNGGVGVGGEKMMDGVVRYPYFVFFFLFCVGLARHKLLTESQCERVMCHGYLEIAMGVCHYGS